MSDPRLQALMHGMIPMKGKDRKDRYEVALGRNIQLFLDELSIDEGPPNPLLPPHFKREKMAVELRESLVQDDLCRSIEAAVQLLLKQGNRYLEAAAFEEIKASFAHAGEILDRLNLDKPITEDFDKILEISEATIGDIFKIALAKFQEAEFDTSLALFILLTVLRSRDFDFWYRTAIAAQECKKFDFALKAYSIAMELNKAAVEPCLFSTECLLQMGEVAAAEATWQRAKEMIENLEDKEEKEALLESLQILIADQKGQSSS